MIQVLRFDGFTEQSNSLINEAVMRANSHMHEKLNTLHLGLSIIEHEALLKDFKEMTWIEDIEYFREDILRELGKIRTFNGEVNIPGCLDADLRLVICRALKLAITENREAEPRDILNSLVYTKDTLFSNLLLDWGIATDTREETGLFTTVKADGTVEDKYVELEKFGVNLNKLVAEGKIDTMVSRDDIIDNLVETLGRKKKANPCLIGEPGVGKTALVEALAYRINNGDVPDYLKGANIISIDIPELVSGCSLRGQFEEKMRDVINTASRCENSILFFDEIHMLMSVGSGQESVLNGANILKPALARGAIRIIGATTIGEYNSFIETDKAFERRLQPIMVDEPSIEECVQIIKKSIRAYEKYHGIEIEDDVIESAVRLSDRYIPNKRLPDKAITILDETAARLKAKGKSDRVSEKDIKYTIYKATGIDILDLNKSDADRLLELETKLSENVIGQEEAIKQVTQAIKRNKIGIIKKNKPIGSFLFVGPTGVGKTELCKTLAREMFGSDKSIIRFDMSEYKEKHSVAKLIGSPPGYKGNREGGLLTEKVKRKPYSIVLLDEIEKAHEAIYDIFLQVLDDGILTDGKGDTIDFKNTIIIMTSNCGCSSETKRTIGFNREDITDSDNIDSSLTNIFKPELLNRIDKVIKFNRLSKENVRVVAEITLDTIIEALRERDINLELSDEIIDYICDKGYDSKYGARNLQRIVQDCIENKLCDLMLAGELRTGYGVHLGYKDGAVTHSIYKNK